MAKKLEYVIKRMAELRNEVEDMIDYLDLLEARARNFGKKRLYKQAPSFIYERGGRYKAMLEWVHDYFATKSKIYQDFFQLSQLIPAPKSRIFPQLQAADYLAFNISKRASHVVDPNPPAGAILETLSDGKKVRQTRYPLLALYSESGSNVVHAPTPEILEKLLQLLEDDDDLTPKVSN